MGIIVQPATPRSALAGIALGRVEATQSAALFGDSVEVDTRVVRSPAEAANAARSLGVDGHAAAIVLAVRDDETCEAVAATDDVIGIPLLNALCPSDALRDGRCLSALFHVAASDAMRRDALATAEHEAPRDGAKSPPETASRTVVAWHPSLEKFGAEQLNRRFRASANDEMDDAAWAGWMALKILLEAALRAHDAGGHALRSYLVRPDVRFDGHKGVPLVFGPWDHQLRQPLYVVSGDVVTEVPAALADDSNARDRLDRLGPDSIGSTCARPLRGFE